MEHPPQHNDARLDAQSVSTLLRLGLGGGRPVDDVIARLEAPDGPRWLARMATLSPLGLVVMPALAAIRSLTPDQIERIKTEAKALIAPSASPDDRMRGVLAYFLVLAAGKVQHGRWPTSQSPAEVAAAVGDLATVLPVTLQGALARAAMEER